MDVVAMVFWRNLISLICISAFLFCRKDFKVLKTARPFAHLGRGLVGTAGIVATYGAFSYLSISQAVVIFFSASLLAPVLGVIFLKEQVGKYRWAAIIIGFVGVVIAAQPDETMQVIGIVVALAAAFLQGLVNLFLRWLGSTEDAKTTTFYFFLIATIATGFFLPFVDFIPDPDAVWMVLALGVGALFAQLSLSHAYRFAEVSIVSLLNYTALIWAAMFDLALWGIIPPVHVFIGGFIIVGSNLFILYRENRRSRTFSGKAS